MSLADFGRSLAYCLIGTAASRMIADIVALWLDRVNGWTPASSS